ncbi:MAG TPA: universal stress protein [Syntrophales bacterium]|nr:universal stress protein [Syntrophales bacterium]
MFDKIVFATDLSKSSDEVITSLGGLRQLGAKQAILVYALGIKALALNHLKDLTPILVELAEPGLSDQKFALEQQGFLTTVRIGTGVPMLEVNQIAEEEQASLIVVGSHGASSIREVLLGGTALAILHHAHLPVLLVRLTISERASAPHRVTAFPDFFRRVLYATDFSETAERALLYVEKIVESGARNITLLHVQEKNDLSKYLEQRLEEFTQINRERLERMRDRLLKLGAKDIQIEIPYGSPLQEIIRYTSQHEYSLIVMGSKGRGFLAKVFMGSVSHGVALHADVPLLMIPPVS